MRGGPRRGDALDAHRWRCRPGGDELGEVDPVHLAGVLRHDVLDHVDPPPEARRADIASNLVLVVLEVGRMTSLSHGRPSQQQQDQMGHHVDFNKHML